MSARRVLGLILAVALAARVAVVLLSPDYRPLFDAADYVRHAVSIGSGHGFPDSVLTSAQSPSAFRPPSYPYLLGGIYAVFGEVDTAGRLAGALLGVLAVWLVYLIARHVWQDQTALVAAAVAAVFPGLVLLNQALISEPLFVVAELAAVLFALRARAAGGDLRWAALAGLSCGLAALTRSNGIFLVIPIAFGVWALRPRFSRRALAAPAVAVAAGLLAVAPWAMRNTLVFDRLTGFNLQSGFALAGMPAWLPTVTGFFAGVFNGLAAMPGPPAVAYYMSAPLPRATVRSSLMVFFLLTSVAAMASGIALGLITLQTFSLSLLGLPVMWIGTKIGHMAFIRGSDQMRRRVSIGSLGVIALVCAIKGLSELG